MSRQLLERERALVGYLLESASIEADLDAIQVQPLADGGMGSLKFIGALEEVGGTAAECHFYDTDGVPVSAVLNLDPNGKPFEVDVWKVDFSPTVTWPKTGEIKAGSIVPRNY